MRSTVVFFAAVFLIAHATIVQGERYSKYDSNLDLLQDYMRYTFYNKSLLYRAMTHSSFSKEKNNEALSILGAKIIETATSVSMLSNVIDLSVNQLNHEVSLTDSACATHGMLLGFHGMVRVSPNTCSSSTYVVCGAFRSFFAAISLDHPSGLEDATNVFWRVQGREPIDLLVMEDLE